MRILLGYIEQSYVTLMLLSGLLVILFANRQVKIKGLQYIQAIIGIVFVLTICEYIESWCDAYGKPIWILYMKAAVTYALHPLLIILELYLIAQVKHKFLLLLPYFLDLAVIVTDLFGANLIYGYNLDHSFKSGRLHFLPAIILCFYLFLLMKYSLNFVRKKDYTKALIVSFIVASAFITIFLEFYGIIVNHTTEIAAIEILIYYFYLAAIYHSKLQDELHKSEIQNVRQKNKLLVAQIQPHFIYNSLMALQSKSVDNPVLYHGIQNFGKYLRANFEAMTDDILIPFKDELKNIKAYIALECINYGEKLNVEYDIEIEDFMLPALSVEPLVENAIRYGIGTYEKGGLIEIIVRKEPDHIHIEVRDDGTGGNKLTEAQNKRKGIGIENVKLRLDALKIGTLSITQDNNGTRAVIWLQTEIEAKE